MKANVIVFDATILILFPVFYFGLSRFLGKSRCRVFITGAVLFSLAIETAAVLGGVKNFYWYALNGYYSHYPLGGYIVWLGLVPLAAVLLWSMIAAASYIAARVLSPGGGRWRLSAVSGLVATCFYLLIEPIAVTNHWWTWNVKSFYIIDVPLLGWLAVFLSVFLFTAAYHVTVVQTQDFRFLSGLESFSVRRWPVRSKAGTAELRFKQLSLLFAGRLVAALVVFGAVIAPVMVVLWLFANRGHIIPGW